MCVTADMATCNLIQSHVAGALFFSCFVMSGCFDSSPVAREDGLPSFAYRGSSQDMKFMKPSEFSLHGVF